jgi:uncharacterized protein YndB with AHSA1/START domain
MSDDTDTTTTRGDRAKVSVFVAVAPAAAFEVFTHEIDLWWRRGPQFRIAGRNRGVLQFEPGVGGRLFESFELDSGGLQAFEVGRITAWQPPSHLAFEWRGVNFAPHEKTVVAVRFEARGEGTLVSVEHSGFSALPSDHPVRHGLQASAFSRMIGLWWGEQMSSLREHVDMSASSSDDSPR